ncbi:MAG: serine/threonine protein kinase, partial [Chloroflexi bacterium]|nr:serine/threonine protein kinase [Chloroflexota bacterium]
MDVTGRVIAGRYVIRQLIGEGGMATIFAAHDQQLNRDVAIKLLRPQFSADPAFAARFRQEARSAGSLDHPNIVSVFDYGVDRDMNFIVMELIHGRDLAAVLAERGPLPIPEALKIASGVGAALEAAHRQGIVHRDVKPGNILLADDGTVKVVDFGIARALSAASVTVTGTILGSVQYFSPEQARGEEATGRSDIYSLGIVLYEMLTARLPFEGESPIGIAFRRLTEEPPPASQFRPDLPTEVIALLDRLLQRDPSDRLPDAAALSAALAAALVMPRRLPEAAEAEPAVGVMTIAPAGTLRAPPSLREAPVAARYRAMRAPLVPPLGGPSRPAGPDAGVGEWRIAAGGELPERRRRNAAWLIPALCLLIVAAFGAFAWLTPERRPDVVAGLASASPAVDPTPDPTAEPAGTPA